MTSDTRELLTHRSDALLPDDIYGSYIGTGVLHLLHGCRHISEITHALFAQATKSYIRQSVPLKPAAEP